MGLWVLREVRTCPEMSSKDLTLAAVRATRSLRGAMQRRLGGHPGGLPAGEEAEKEQPGRRSGKQPAASMVRA